MSAQEEIPDIKDENKQYYLYKWYFEFYDADDEENKIFPDKVIKIVKHSPYKQKVLPVLTATMRFANIDLLKLKAIQKRCLCTITCKSLIMSPNDSPDETVVSGRSYVLSDSKIEFSSTFEPVFDKNTFKSKFNDDETVENEENKEVATPDNTPDSPTQLVYITFFNLSAQKAIKNLYNTVIEEGSTVGTVLEWICSETGLKYIIDKPANQNEQPEIIIPPLSLIPAINYMQEMFGVYENGLQTFIDLYDKDNIIYVLDKFNIEHDRKQGDTPLTHVYYLDIDKTGPNSMIRAENKDKEGMYIGVPLMRFSNDEVMKGELLGNNFIFSSFEQSIDAVSFDTDNKVVSGTEKEVATVMKRNTETHKSSGEKTVCDYDELNNLLNMASQFNAIESYAERIHMILLNVKIDDFAVNKIIEMHFQNTNKNLQLSGKYYLNEVQYTFDMLPSATAVFKIDSDFTEETDLGYAPAVTSCRCAIDISRRNPSKKA